MSLFLFIIGVIVVGLVLSVFIEISEVSKYVKELRFEKINENNRTLRISELRQDELDILESILCDLNQGDGWLELSGTMNRDNKIKIELLKRIINTYVSVSKENAQHKPATNDVLMDYTRMASADIEKMLGTIFGVDRLYPEIGGDSDDTGIIEEAILEIQRLKEVEESVNEI